jgi:hypothetical protein
MLVAEIKNCHSLNNGQNIRFGQKLGKSLSETFNVMKQVYGKEALGRSVVFKWHQCFAQGRESLEDDEGTHRISHNATSFSFTA